MRFASITLAALIALGHNGRITTALVATVAVYLGVDLTVLCKWRPKD